MPEVTADLLVVGSGAAGLAAAVTAAVRGLKVIVAEKAPLFGGTTAWSGGWLWIPGNPLALGAGIRETPEAPRRYLRELLGNRYEPAKIDAFLTAGPEMVAFFERETALEFIAGNTIPDFHEGVPGAAAGGRSLAAAPYDGRRLGTLIARLRPPIPELTLRGMAIASGADLAAFLNWNRSPRAFFHVAGRMARHARDLLFRHRSMQLVNGNALAARLLRSALDRNVTLWHSTPARRLLSEGGRVTGALLEGPDGPIEVRVTQAVLLAAGGFPHDPARQQVLFPHVKAGTPHHSAAPECNTGDGLALAETVGGVVETGYSDAGAWAPVSLVPRADGSVGRFPHLVDRAKPGIIAVTQAGQRFVNEAGPYHDFLRGLFRAVPAGRPVEAWLLADHRFLRRYGLGAVKPAPFPLGRHLRSGYLREGASIARLAAAAGIDAAGLEATVAAYNRAAAAGEDPAFGRGTTLYQRLAGDPRQHPNPCVAPIVEPPFYAVRIVPGSLGTFAGIVTDASARVLDRSGRPIPGLFAAGNDMASIMAGQYPSGGITLGPAMTFGWIAAQKIADDAEIQRMENNRHDTCAAD